MPAIKRSIYLATQKLKYNKLPPHSHELPHEMPDATEEGFSIPDGSYFIVLDNSGNFKAAYMTPKLVEVVETHARIKSGDATRPHVVRFPTYGSDTDDKMERARRLIQACVSAGMENLKGIIISGGPLCLSESNPFNLYSLNVGFITLFRDTPIFGICFGMQVVAACQFGPVESVRPCARRVNGGIFKGRVVHDGVFIAPDRRGWLPVVKYCEGWSATAPLPPRSPRWAFHYHSDGVFSLLYPFSRVTLVGLHQGEVLIMGFKSDRDGTAAARWGVQFHPEAHPETHKYIHNFMDHCYEQVPPAALRHKIHNVVHDYGRLLRKMEGRPSFEEIVALSRRCEELKSLCDEASRMEDDGSGDKLSLLRDRVPRYTDALAELERMRTRYDDPLTAIDNPPRPYL